jgi:predicted amidohydrolase
VKSVHLIAVQSELRLEHYREREAFEARVLELCARAVEGLPEGEPRIIAFPEAFALPLVFWLETPEQVVRSGSALEAGLRLLRLRWREALGTATLSPSALFHLRALEVWPLWERAFARAARQSAAYVIAGSLFSPLVDWEPARGYHRKSRRVYNLSLVFNPQGTLLARVPKINLTMDERRSFLQGGSWGDQVIHTRLGRIANLICLDAFHEHLIERCDAAGAWLVVQPSANAARWEGPWSADPARLEGQVWLREGLARKLEGRENLRYGINPMLNGRLYNFRFEGRSGVYAPGQVLALADLPTGDAIVRSRVEPP